MMHRFEKMIRLDRLSAAAILIAAGYLLSATLPLLARQRTAEAAWDTVREHAQDVINERVEVKGEFLDKRVLAIEAQRIPERLALLEQDAKETADFRSAELALGEKLIASILGLFFVQLAQLFWKPRILARAIKEITP